MNQEGTGTTTVEVSFTGTALPMFGRALLLAIAQFLIIPMPWAAAAFYRWIIKHLSLNDGTRVNFEGKGGHVWYIFMLIALSGYAGFVPIPFFPILLLPLTVLLWLVVIKWLVQNVKLSCGTQLSFSGTYWQYLGWSVLIAVSVYTIIGWAWATAAMIRWLCRHIHGGNHCVLFAGSGWNILWRTIVTALSCLLIIPIPWTTLWLAKWYIGNVRIEKNTQ
ncbi:hypothetical protein ES703_121011 [subsurface metagenome]